MEPELPPLDLAPDLMKAGHDLVGLGLCEKAAFGQHPRMRDTALDIVPVEAPVKLDGGGVGLDQRVGRLREPPAPRLMSFPSRLHRLVRFPFACRKARMRRRS